jgi:hypothetical protein
MRGKYRLIYLLTIFLILLLTGCDQSDLPVYYEKGPILTEVSDDWGIITDDRLPKGYRVINNVWNKQAAAPGPSYQKIFLEDIEGKIVCGWKWQWPMSRDVIAYPEMVYGVKPWDQGDTPYASGGELPFQAGTKSITVNFNIGLQAVGSYNTAFSLWAISDCNNPRVSITHEIMIWIANHRNEPAGLKRGSLQTNGIMFDLYVNPGQNDHTGYYSNSWTYVAFVAREPVLNSSLDLGAFITHLLNKGILTTDNYITSIELGNEIVGGVGLAEINDYSIDIQ